MPYLQKYSILRHAEREKIESNVAKAKLTERGKEQAYLLGKKLSNEITEKTLIASTCFKRTYETAYYFWKGSKEKAKLIKLEEIVEHVREVKEGYFVRWWESYNEEFFNYINSKPSDSIHKEWFEGELFNTLEVKEIVERDLKKLDELEEDYGFDKIIVFSHDSTIVYFWKYFYDEVIENPGFLEGITSKDIKKWKLVKW